LITTAKILGLAAAVAGALGSFLLYVGTLGFRGASDVDEPKAC
jgi:hypothetical protein